MCFQREVAPNPRWVKVHVEPREQIKARKAQEIDSSWMFPNLFKNFPFIFPDPFGIFSHLWGEESIFLDRPCRFTLRDYF